MGEIKKYLNQKVYITIDRPLGSKHPTYGFEYLINYGYIPNTVSGDGKEIDAYILGIIQPLKEFEGICIAIIERTNDADPKLIVVPEGKNFNDTQIREQTYFQEKYFDIRIIRK